MDLNNLALFKVMSRKIDWLTQRQEVLSKNIANSDTPEFKPHDLTPFSFRDALADNRRLATTSTSVSHLSGTLAPGGQAKEQRVHDPYETKPDGNAVVLEEQMMKMSKTNLDHQTLIGLYRKQVAMLKTALGHGGQ